MRDGHGIGLSKDSQCVLTLYLRPCKVQVCLLLPEKTSSAVAAALDMLERAIGKPLFQRPSCPCSGLF